MSDCIWVQLRETTSLTAVEHAFRKMHIKHSPATIGGRTYYHTDGCEVSVDVKPSGEVTSITFRTQTSYDLVMYKKKLIEELDELLPVKHVLCDNFPEILEDRFTVIDWQ